ncbi:MAG: EscU/YscU/HrcU family type III secretion system export apparatus switch protein [Pirellulales bacterium]|nr:EscU/YscU/HrcU family type III secretion system export apparatus switch protein [Pirellulales bacterium]
MSDYAGEKTLEPTPHRRQQARSEGHVAKSRDLVSAGVLMLGLGALGAVGGALVGFLVDLCRAQLGGRPWLNADAEFAVSQWNTLLWGLGGKLLPVLGLIFLAGVAVNVLQTGFLFLPQRLKIDPQRVSPLGGLERIFSSSNLVGLAFGVAKLLVVAAVAGAVLYGERQSLAGLAALDPEGLALGMFWISFRTTLKVGGVLLALAVLDYAYQRWRYERDLRMTPQELREEARNLEGDPRLAARRKQRRRELSLRRVEGQG